VALVQYPQVRPRCRMRLVKLDRAHVRLEGVEGLILLLVQDAYAAPGVRVTLGLFHGVPAREVDEFVSGRARQRGWNQSDSVPFSYFSGPRYDNRHGSAIAKFTLILCTIGRRDYFRLPSVIQHFG
jgi:hypothetical protein